MDAEMAALVERMDRLEAENADLKSAMAIMAARSAPPPAAADPELNGRTSSRDDRVSRRHALRTGLAATGAAVAGAVLLNPTPAAAANGDPMVLGTFNNFTTAPTGVVTLSTTAPWGLGSADSVVTDYGDKPAIGAAASGSFLTGVKAIATGGTGLTAVRAEAHGENTAALITSDTGTAADISTNTGRALKVTGSSNGAVASITTQGPGNSLYVESANGNGAVYVFSNGYHLSLHSDQPPPNTTGDTNHLVGEVLCDTNGTLWYCLGANDWRKLGGRGTAGQLHLLNAPVRAYDSRAGTAPSGGSKTPLPANTARTIDLKNNHTGVPADATGVLVTVLLVNTTPGLGNFTIWANGLARPSGNTMVFGGNATRFSTLAVTRVDAAGQCQVYSSLKTDLTVDVVGYYR
jgi:hypothetical protein